MTPIVNPIPADLTLAKGAHNTPDNGMCLLEAAAYISGERHSDHPACVSPVIATFGRKWNDDLPDDDRQRLLMPLLPLLLDTASTEEVEEARVWMVTDWMVRECAPAWLRLAGLVEQADELESLPVMSPESASAGLSVIDRAHTDVAAAWSAAWDASLDVSWSVARDISWDATRAAAVAAASVTQDVVSVDAWAAAVAAAEAAAVVTASAAAGAAAGEDAAWDDARSAAWDALAPTVTAMQESAVALVERMCALTPETLAQKEDDRD